MSGDATTLLTSQLGAAAACAYIQNILQKWNKTPWITQHTSQINFIFRASLSGASAIGISFVWNPTDHSLLITGLGLMAMIHAGWHWFTQYAITHMTAKVLESKQAEVK